MKTINFKKISITNFLSFGKTQEYEFENGITLVCGRNKDRVDDPNGCGKCLDPNTEIEISVPDEFANLF